MAIQPMRLHRMIALSSDLSRRAAEEAIAEGRVAVNGAVVTAMGTSVDPRTDRVALDGKPLELQGKRHYFAYYKPRRVIVTKSDPQGRPTIWDQLKEWKGKLNAVGRLDFESEGLLLLTDDGDFLNRLTHPRHGIWKVYRVRVKGEPSAGAMHELVAGVKLSDGVTLPAKVRRIDRGDSNALIEIAIREGRNRQVRRMCDAVGHAVIHLKRISVGPVKLGRMTVGKLRPLRSDEVHRLLEGSKEKA